MDTQFQVDVMVDVFQNISIYFSYEPNCNYLSISGVARGGTWGQAPVVNALGVGKLEECPRCAQSLKSGYTTAQYLFIFTSKLYSLILTGRFNKQPTPVHRVHILFYQFLTFFKGTGNCMSHENKEFPLEGNLVI